MTDRDIIEAADHETWFTPGSDDVIDMDAADARFIARFNPEYVALLVALYEAEMRADGPIRTMGDLRAAMGDMADARNAITTWREAHDEA